ncbi:MAG: glycosyltransferase [Planctomycetes bacterium]|nr:glycosyltransferase [Planctomycetota bacterium]
MRVSVIIPALNESDRIGAAIDSARAARCDEVLVADGGSIDGTRELAARHGAQVIEAPRGRAFQQNAASRVAIGDVLLFLHADNRLGGACASQIIDAFTADSIRVCGAFRQRIDAPELGFRIVEWGNAFRAGRLGLPYGDQALFFRREAFERFGRFPETPFLEDFILMRRVRRAARPLLLPGPIHVDARRWKRRGIVAQVVRNWTILGAYAIGVPPERLARWYPRHDRDASARRAPRSEA